MQEFLCTQVESGAFFADEMFRRAFDHDLPDWGHHLVLFYRKSPTHFIPLTYLNFAPHENVILVGGGVTNGRAFEHVEPTHARKLREMGGGLYLMLRYGFEKFADECDAYFGHAGDARALEVDLQAGFERTRHAYLLANFHKPLPEAYKEELIEKVNALGAF